MVTQYIEGKPHDVNQLHRNIIRNKHVVGTLNVHEDTGLMIRRHEGWEMRCFESYKEFMKLMVRLYGKDAFREFQVRRFLQGKFPEDVWMLICDYEICIDICGTVPVTMKLVLEFLFRPPFMQSPQCFVCHDDEDSY